MAGDPAPLSRAVTVVSTSGPVPSKMPAPDRDDDPSAFPQDYTVTEIFLDHTLRDPLGGAPLARRSHGRLFVPAGAPPPGGFPAVLALNGHTGSSLRMTDPDDVKYWFGDGYARRGFVVLALDVSHRPLEDRRGLYDDFLMGDSPMGGNFTHPAVKSPGLDSDWEEDGERAWDALRALDYLRSLPQVDAARLVVTGHSMGGEVASYVGALDEGVAVTVASAPSTDFGVMLHHGNHPCWRWLDADVREYLDMSDLHALDAPRALVIETGKADFTYSQMAAPWAGAKQVARRARPAYAGVERSFVHYLHYDQHHYHAGDLDPTMPVEQGVRVPGMEAPASPWSLDWQTDGATSGSVTLFELIDAHLQP
jgi:dienelactone hydrolase